jgi:YidC/Oxa1 family membrane protein insertase
MQQVFLDLLLFFYNNLAFHNLGITILEISVLVRLVFWPVARQQAKYSKKMAELQPHLAALKAKHKDNKQAFATAQMGLFKEHGVNPAAGCLPSLIQIVVLFGLLGALNKIIAMPNINTYFLGLNMAGKNIWYLPGLPFPMPGILVIIAAATQYVQTKLMMPTPPKIRKEDKKVEKEEKEDFMTSFAEAQGQMVWMFPLLFLFLGTQWPAGLALYWSVSSVLSIAQIAHTTGFARLKDPKFLLPG